MKHVMAILMGLLLSTTAFADAPAWIEIVPHVDTPSCVVSDGGGVLARTRHSLSSAAISFWTAVRSGLVLIFK